MYYYISSHLPINNVPLYYSDVKYQGMLEATKTTPTETMDPLWETMSESDTIDTTDGHSDSNDSISEMDQDHGTDEHGVTVQVSLEDGRYSYS